MENIYGGSVGFRPPERAHWDDDLAGGNHPGNRAPSDKRSLNVQVGSEDSSNVDVDIGAARNTYIEFARGRTALARLRAAMRRLGPGAMSQFGKNLRSSMQWNPRAMVRNSSSGCEMGMDPIADAFHRQGVGISDEEVSALLFAARGADERELRFDIATAIIRALCGPLSHFRDGVVREVFQVLRTSCNGQGGALDSTRLRAILERIANRVDARLVHASKHAHVGDPPDATVEAGSARDALIHLLGSASVLHWRDFLNYYEGVSAGVEDDQLFVYVVRRTWGLDPGPHGFKSHAARRHYRGNISAMEGGLCGPE